MKVVARRYFRLLLLFIVFSAKLHAQNSSNQGTEFWVAFPTHEPDIDDNANILDANLSVFITGPAFSSGTVTAGSFTQHFNIAANQVVEVKVPRQLSYINETEAGSVLPGRAVHILVDPGAPKIVVYAHIFSGRRSAASLILPKETLGKEYYSMNYGEYNDEGKNFITIIATESDTRVFLKKNGVDLVPGGIYLPDKNDVYEYLSPNDLTGVAITAEGGAAACKRFAVFSGCSGVRIGTPGCVPKSLDPLFQQCYPVLSWGTQYGFVPFAMTRPNGAISRTAGQYLRVVAKEPQTMVMLNGKLVATLNQGEFYTTVGPLATPALISASAPVSVAEYSPTQACANINNSEDPAKQGFSDPDMVILNPIEFNIKNITVYSSTRENISEQYINVLIKTASTGSFRINGGVPATAFQDFTPLPGYSFLQLNLNSYPVNTFNLSADDGFNAVAYGFGDLESYAYSAGTNLAATQNITAVDAATGADIDFACIDKDYFFKLTLPFIAEKIIWKMDEQESPVVQQAPTYQKVVKNGLTSYEYTLPKTAAYQNSGTHLIRIEALYPAGQIYCENGSEIVEGAFKVFDLPEAKITSAALDCNNGFNFQATPKADEEAKSWEWNFGDNLSGTNNTAAGQNVSHDFTAGGTYEITLTTTSVAGCISVTSYQLNVPKRLTPDFAAPNQACVGEPVAMEDKSVVNGYTVSARIWDFGDGTAPVTTTGATTLHTFANPGVFQVNVTLMSDKGCIIGRLEKQITIDSKPVPSFTYSSNCLADALITFTNTTGQATNNADQLTYLWDFGDSQATAANPNNSSLKNPAHHYSAAGIYQVSLIVITPGGCKAMAVIPVTVNDLPVAAFDVTAQPVCSGTAVLFTNQSFVAGFGSITKLEWVFDAANHPDEKEAFDTPAPGQTYRHTYPIFSGAPYSREFTVTLFVYSGGGCFSTVSHNIKIGALPVITFAPLPPVCISDSPFRLTSATEATGIPGSYSGLGVTQNGFFNPSLAGPGVHTVTYTVTSPEGCVATATQSLTVMEQPKVSMPATKIVSPGSSVRLDAMYTGTNLSYTWTPSTSLSDPTAANPVATPEHDVIYTVTASNGACSVQGTVETIILTAPVVSNTFTPNGDGINDSMEIKNLDKYPTASVFVYNRYGSLVFHSTGINKIWDGKYHGSYVPFGIYYYVIQVGKGRPPYTGYVTVLH